MEKMFDNRKVKVDSDAAVDASAFGQLWYELFKSVINDRLLESAQECVGVVMSRADTDMSWGGRYTGQFA